MISWGTIIISLISSSLAATIVGGFFTWFVNENLDRRQRVMEMRKKIYSDTIEELAGFYNTATQERRQNSSEKLLALYRQVQLWASADVVKQFNKFWDVFIKNGKSQSEIGTEYANLIIAMRKELTGEDIAREEIRRYGKIS